MKSFIELSQLELLAKLSELKIQLLNLKLSHGVGRLDKTHNLLKTRRDIARVKTFLQMKK